MRLVMFFQTRLEIGACHANASCRSWLLVKREYVLSCFSERFLKLKRAMRMRLAGLVRVLFMNTSSRSSISGIASSTLSINLNNDYSLNNEPMLVSCQEEERARSVRRQDGRRSNPYCKLDFCTVHT